MPPARTTTRTRASTGSSVAARPKRSNLPLAFVPSVLAALVIPAPGTEITSTTPPVRIRDVGVLLADGVSGVRVRADSNLLAADVGNIHKAVLRAGETAIVRRDGEGLRIDGVGVPWPDVQLRAEGDAPIVLSMERDNQWTPEATYPGRLTIRSPTDGGLRVVNEVEVEPYVACVVANEVWPTFETEAFRAQAIVSRSFVLYQMTRRGDPGVTGFDVSATQGSQVYRGLRSDAVGEKASQAAEYTRAIVLTFRDGQRDRLFCTYYSAACGGSSQSAALLGAEGDVPPLRGGVRCDYCRIAAGDAYRWGPVRVPLVDVQARLGARYPDIAALRRLTSVAAVETPASGRIVTLRLTGSSGRTEELSAERFRIAIGPTLMKSTDCRIRVTGDELLLEDGKGYGHGLGLCQWGAQGLALEGQHAGEILRFYYPGAQLTRVY